MLAGVSATKVENKQPHLVNLNEDPQLSEILLYMLPEGHTKVGRQRDDSGDVDIQLSGALISDYHWSVTSPPHSVLSQHKLWLVVCIPFPALR